MHTARRGRLAYLIVVPLFLLALRPISDMDFWWHLAAGRWIAENGSVPRVDPFTNTAGGEPWIAHEWLAELVFWWTHQAAGLRGVQVLVALAVAGGLAVHVWTLRRTGVRGALPAVVYALLVYFLFSPRVQTRPHVFGDFLFPAIFYALLVTCDWHPRGRRVAAIGGLTALWANFHSGATLASIVLGAATGAEIAHVVWARRGGDRGESGVSPPAAASAGWDRARALGVATLVAFVALIATPSHVERLLFPLQVFHVTTQSITVGEWRPLFVVTEPGFVSVQWIVPVILQCFLIVTLLRLRAARWAETVAASLLGAMAIAASRFAVFFFAQAHAVLRAVAHDESAGRSVRPVRAILAVWCVALAALIWNHDVGLWEPGILRQMQSAGVGAFAPQFEPNFPVAATRFLDEVRLTGRMFNIPRWGGYLAYHLYPEYKTSYDGRIDLFDPKVSRDMMDVMENRTREEILAEYGFDFLVVDSRFFAPARPAAEHWRLVWSDASARVYLRDSARNAANFERCRAYYAAHGGAAGGGGGAGGAGTDGAGRVR